jgi:uncharacterized protein (TIGR02246 family)
MSITRRSLRLAAAAALLLPLAVAAPAAAQQPTPPQTPAPAPAPSPDEAAVRKVIADFNTAFDKADANALAALFTDDGQVVGPDGAPARGKAAIAAQYADFFKQNPGAKIEVNTESIRFLAPGVAQEEGISIVHPADGSEPFRDRYSVIYLLQNGKWLQHEVRDYPTPNPDQANPDDPNATIDADTIAIDDPLSQLDWIIGDWVDESPEVTITHSCRYILNGRFIVREYSAQRDQQQTVEGLHIIGYDAQSGLYKSWGFDGEGSRGEATWARDGDRWVIKMQGVLGDGRSVSATQILERVNKDAVKMSAVERTIDGVLAPDRDEITLVRKPPAPPESAPATAPAAAPATAPAPAPVAPAQP